MMHEHDVKLLNFHIDSALAAGTADAKDHYLVLAKSILNSPMLRLGGDLVRPENPTSALRDARAKEVEANNACNR